MGVRARQSRMASSDKGISSGLCISATPTAVENRHKGLISHRSSRHVLSRFQISKPSMTGNRHDIDGCLSTACRLRR